MQKSASLVDRSHPNLDEKAQDRSLEPLTLAVADLFDLDGDDKPAHWNIVGTDFYQLRLMFDEFKEKSQKFVDMAAERAITLVRVAHGTVPAAADNSSLEPFPLDERDERRLPDALVKRIHSVTEDLRTALQESETEPVTQDVYMDILKGIEMQRWMLEAHLA